MVKPFDIKIDPSGMEATVIFSSTSPPPKPFTYDDLKNAFRQQGIVEGVDVWEEKRLLRILSGEESPGKPLVIARGREPSQGIQPEVRFQVKPGAFVKKDQVIALLEGGAAPEMGKTVIGKEIPAPAPLPDPIAAGHYVRYEESDQSFVSETSGIVHLAEKKIEVLRLFSISDDEMTAEVTLVYPGKGKVGANHLDFKSLLNNSGIVYGIIEDQLREIQKPVVMNPGECEKVVVARGTYPIAGKDAWIQYHSLTRKEDQKENAKGQMDFRWRRPIPDVKTGDLIITVIPAEEGSPGKTVTGKILPAIKGKELKIAAGSNVKMSMDGKEFKATAAGVGLLVGNRLEVADLFEVKGDVNHATGNIDCGRGVLVRGTVHSTFSVQAKGVVSVLGAVEDAVIIATGQIDVERGIFRRTMGRVRGRADIHASHTQNAQVFAYKSIRILNSSIHSFLAAEKQIEIVEGKGIVIGGHLVSGDGIEIKVAGSEMNVHTVLQVGFSFEKFHKIEDQLGQIEEDRLRILIEGGENFLSYASGERLAPKVPSIQVLLSQWGVLSKKEENLEKRKQKLLRESAKDKKKDASILIRDKIYPGVELIIGEATLRIRKISPGGRYFFSSKESAIKRVSC